MAECNSAYVAIFPWWPHKPSEEEIGGMASIREHCRLPLVCVLPEGENPPEGLSFAGCVRFPSEYFKSGWAYSRLLLSEAFYDAFRTYDYMIIVQSDVLLLRTLDAAAVREFEWDYVGAPWVRKGPDGRCAFAFVGNGGFSLRKVATFRRVLQERARFCRRPASQRLNHRWVFLIALANLAAVLRFKISYLAKLMVPLGIHEDTFWSRVAPIVSSGLRICDAEMAARFAVEREPAFVVQFSGPDGPIGAHGWRKHGKEFFLPYIASGFRQERQG